MRQYKSRAELKDLAKDKLTGKFGSAIWALIIVSMVTRAVTGTLTAFLPTGGWFWTIASILFTAVISAFLGILQTGIAYFFLNISCDMDYSYGNVFHGFHEHPEKSLKISIPFAALQTICTLPFQILLLLFIQNFDYKYLLAAYIFMFIGYAVTAPFKLAISQSYYLLLDFPDAAAKEVLQNSIRIMKGNKWRLFKLELSFLPLQILCIFTLGIGNIWLDPYMRMTYAQFFLDLMNPAE